MAWRKIRHDESESFSQLAASGTVPAGIWLAPSLAAGRKCNGRGAKREEMAKMTALA